MGFLFSPERKSAGPDPHAGHHERDQAPAWSAACRLPWSPWSTISRSTRRERRLRCISGDDALMPAGYYTQQVPPLIRTEMPRLSPARRAELERFTAACRSKADYAGMIQTLFDHMLPAAQDAKEPQARTLQNSARSTTALTASSTNRSARIFVPAASVWRRIACPPPASLKMPRPISG